MTAFAIFTAEFANAFERRMREGNPDAPEYMALRDGAPEWMTDVVRACHMGGDMLPDDWRYRFIASCAAEIAELVADHPDQDDLSDEAAERIDSLVPVYNTDRTDWLGSHSYRASYVDEACADSAVASTGIIERIGYGIYAEIQEIWETLSRELQDRANAVPDEVAAALEAKGFAIEEGGACPAFYCYRSPDGRGCIVATSEDGGEPSEESWLVCLYSGPEPMGEAFAEIGASGGEASFGDVLAAAFAQLSDMAAR